MKQKAIISIAGVLLVILGALLAYGFLSLLHNGTPVESNIRTNSVQGYVFQ